MYKLEVKKTPGSDAQIEMYESDIEDIANTIPDKLGDVCDGGVSISGNILSFESSLSKDEIKYSLRDTFSYHSKSIRFVDLVKC